MPARSEQYSFHEKAVFVAQAILCNENVECRKKGISLKTYYNWRKCFVKACEQIMAENSALACLRQRQITKDISGYIAELRHAAIERQRLDRHRIKAQTSNKVDHLRSRHEGEIELMNFIENVALSKVETLKIAGLSRATYYRWRKRLAETGTVKDLRERSNKVRTKDIEMMSRNVYSKFCIHRRQTMASIGQLG